MISQAEQASAPEPQPRFRMTRFRWVILALVFFATTVNYLDRSVMALLATDLQSRFSIGEKHYGYIQSAFAISYAIGQLVCGKLLDVIGVKLGFALALTAWSLASIGHALARSAWGFGFARALLGLAESPNFPAATKTLAEWFPKRERAFAFGFVNAGTNMGAILAPMTVPWLATTYGWQWAFVGTGAIGLLWLIFWLPLYRAPHEHPAVSAEELAHIKSDPPEPATRVSWLRLFTYRAAWAFAVGKFLTDSMWWFFMTWVPKFLEKQHGVKLLQVGLPLVVIYLMADAGSIAGGWMSSSLIKRGATVNRARKLALLVCALAVIPVTLSQSVTDLWTGVLILGLATAAHQGFSSNLYTLVSDMFPKRYVASVAGLGGTAGYFGASIFQVIVGHMVENTGSYVGPFLIAGCVYLVAFGLIHLLVPTIKPAVRDG